MIDNNNGKTKYIRTASIVAIIGNAVLAILKITTGIFSSSVALISDGIDSSTDVLTSIISLVVVRIISKPADIEHPWGHGRAETISTAFLSFIIFFAGAQLIINSISTLSSGSRTFTHSPVAIIVTLISIVGKILLALNQHILGKKANSPMIEANAKNMASDVLISAGVLVGLIISAYTESAHADTIITILIGAWIIKTAIGIFLEANLELMDGNNDMEPYHVIARVVNSVEGASNPHHARIRRVAGLWDIDFDIDVDPNCTVLEAHTIASKVESELKKNLENVYDIVIQIEPRGDDAPETFGLSEDDMRGGETTK